ncbi:MAG: septum formation protein Maf [Bacilli bacterium]|nr:septum formation protein Maf [Bacilli bacterium]
MFILASSSPRRKELLRKIVPEFEILVPEIDESLLHIDAKDLPSEESKAKAYAIACLYPHDEVLSCDTVVVLHGEALGKPKDYDDAFAMLKAQSGQKEIVLSAYTYIGHGKEITRTVATEVYFNDLSDEQIHDYLQTKKPFDKAGAYGIQDDFPLIREIVGSFDNVMGLPTEDIYEHVILRGRSRR